jgi:hypothetical protein
MKKECRNASRGILILNGEIQGGGNTTSLELSRKRTLVTLKDLNFGRQTIKISPGRVTPRLCKWIADR